MFLKYGVAAFATVALSVTAAFARSPDVYTSTFSSLAVGGYDSVAYFKQGKPVLGSAQFTMEWKGATWRFASKEDLEAFRANPIAYAPQFGGYCAWAVAHGYTASGDPLVWKLVDGKLYLNYDRDVQSQWEKDIPRYIADGNKNWPSALDH
jgi:YHS domain-containing protein